VTAPAAVDTLRSSPRVLVLKRTKGIAHAEIGRAARYQRGSIAGPADTSMKRLRGRVGGWSDDLERLTFVQFLPEPSKDLLERILASRAAGHG